MKDPVDHIERPRLPWRDTADGAATECGLNAAKVSTLTRDQFFQRVKDLGQQRTAMLTCMTCCDTARRWGTWNDDPRNAVQREIEWERNGRWSRSDDRGTRLRDELTAIADLIAAHKEEFTSSVEAIKAKRDWLAKKQALNAKPKIARMPGSL